jgi:hypothetical protein
MPQGVQRYRTVHRSAVDENISQPCGNGLGKGAFTATRKSVYRYGKSFHDHFI